MDGNYSIPDNLSSFHYCSKPPATYNPPLFPQNTFIGYGSGYTKYLGAELKGEFTPSSEFEIPDTCPYLLEHSLSSDK